MKKYNNLLAKVADEYSINKGFLEDEKQWKVRLIYTIIGRMALASTWDISEENVSIVHMKKRIEKVVLCYRNMYYEVADLLPESPTILADEIYEIYVKTGVIYHEPNHILMSVKTTASVGNITFTRGCALNEKQSISGLGTYVSNYSKDMSGNLADMFCLEAMPLKTLWEYNILKTNWTPFKIATTIEYLRKEPPFNCGYWLDKPDESGRVSILRTGFKGAQLYYLYKFEQGCMVAGQLPEWKVKEGYYRLLSNACLASEGTLPPIRFHYDGEIVYVNFGYLPPELYLWKLYSWPISRVSLPRDFNRICSCQVFEAIRDIMEQQGYQFTEE